MKAQLGSEKDESVGCRVCPACGTATDSLFCPNCGTKLD